MVMRKFKFITLYEKISFEYKVIENCCLILFVSTSLNSY